MVPKKPKVNIADMGYDERESYIQRLYDDGKPVYPRGRKYEPRKQENPVTAKKISRAKFAHRSSSPDQDEQTVVPKQQSKV